MNEQEAIEQLKGEYLATNGTETPARVRYHNEALDTAIAALKEVQEYHATGRTPDMVRGLIGGYNRARKQCQEATSQLKQYEEIGTPEQCREAVERTRWIPVSERMPECSGNRYFLCICNKEDKVPYILQYEKGLGFGIRIKVPVAPGRYESEFSTIEELGCEKVSFWLPLPEPYYITNPDKKEEHNGEKSSK